MYTISVVMAAGICNSVGGGVLLTCHHSAGASVGGKYLSVSRLGLLIGNWWMSWASRSDRPGCPGMR